MDKMNLHRFFVLPETIKDGRVVIKGSDVKHIKNVLRLKKGNNIIIFDGAGKEYLVTIEDIKNDVKGKITHQEEAKDKKHPKIVLLQGIPKGSKMDFVIQKCTEAGVNRIVPLITERTIVKLNGKRLTEKQKRWQKIAKSSAQQSGSVTVPHIDEPVAFFKALDRIDSKALNLIAWEAETSNSLKKVLKQHCSLIQQEDSVISVFVGPEGGFSYKEIEKVRLEGAIPVSLGSRILRTETAGFAIAIMILYETGALG